MRKSFSTIVRDHLPLLGLCVIHLFGSNRESDGGRNGMAWKAAHTRSYELGMEHLPGKAFGSKGHGIYASLEKTKRCTWTHSGPAQSCHIIHSLCVSYKQAHNSILATRSCLIMKCTFL